MKYVHDIIQYFGSNSFIKMYKYLEISIDYTKYYKILI